MRTASAVRATAAVVKTVPVERGRLVSAQNASVRTASAVRVVPVERSTKLASLSDSEFFRPLVPSQ